MTLRWLSTQLWRHRVMGLLLALCVTLLLMLLATQSLQHPSHYAGHKGHKVEERGALSNNALPNTPVPSHTAPNGRKAVQTPNLQHQSDPNGYTFMRTRRSPPPVAFLKTHKTGSSTVQNLMFRLGEKENLTFAFPYYAYQFSYPDRFRADFVDELPPGSSQFDMLCSHMRLDLGQVKQVMPRNTIYITLLRDPLQTFESVFSYYTSTVPAFTLAKKAADTANMKSALSVFLEAPESYWDPTEPGNGLARNPMSFDLGLSSQEWNASWPMELTQLEEAFQLVMIAEHFDESLVLLGALLQLEPEELAYVRLNVRAPSDITPLEDDTKARLWAWNSLDVLLYNLFLQVFWEKAEQYGLGRLKREVALLRASTQRLRQKCVAREGVPPGELEDLVRPWQTDTVTILGYKVRGNLTLQEEGLCVRLVLPELQYHSHLYFQQYGHDMRSIPTD
ncbi:galactose-3-O-sulfotransferase 2-like [Oncorhynchus keta]|uniref:galactose-3-O-sulfotransferase 2-like n=1 Tax=Oncorhynchus keta TaxID=8018 RepID=UPI0015F94A0C|nr:galactose-3-O-sulfotransferase 2-like [Oncorhynchus keta]